MAYIQVITTLDSEEKANEIANYLLKKRVVACVQIFPISSSYWWKCKIEKAIKEIHPYETPEILEIEINRGNEDYLEWVDKEIK